MPDKEPSPMSCGTITLNIAELGINFTGNADLTGSMKTRYEGFISAAESASIQIALHETAKLEPSFCQSRSIPEIRHLEDGFEIEQAPYFYIRYSQKTGTGQLTFTQKSREASIYLEPETSPLAYGLRRGIGVLFITLLAQDQAPGFHGAAINVDGCGILAPGDSGTGKSTFFSMFPEPMQLNDEFVIVRDTPSGPRVFSTPFSEEWDKERKNRSAELTILLKLVQAPDIQTRLIKAPEILQILNHNQILPAGAEQECQENFGVLFNIAQKVKGLELSFTLDGEAVINQVRSMASRQKSR